MLQRRPACRSIRLRRDDSAAPSLSSAARNPRIRNHDELFPETGDRPALVSDDRPRHARVSIRRAAVSTTTNRNSAITEIPHRPAGRQRLLATYFIGRHICRWQGDRLSND